MANTEQIKIWKAQRYTFRTIYQNQYGEQSESIKRIGVHLHSQIRKLLCQQTSFDPCHKSGNPQQHLKRQQKNSRFTPTKPHF